MEIPWDEMRWDRHKLPWDGMEQKNMSHGQACSFKIFLFISVNFKKYIFTYGIKKQQKHKN